MKLYINFLEFILAPLNEFNTSFQADSARIGILADQIRRLLRKFLGKFVKTAVIAASSDVTTVPYEDVSSQLSNELIAVGTKNRTYLVDYQDNIGIELEQKLFRAVRLFYVTIVSKMIKKFPFTDVILKEIGFINPSGKHSFTTDSVLNLVKRFPGIVNEDEVDLLTEQFTDYQLAPVGDLPPCVTDDNIEQCWGEMGKMDDIFTGNKRFGVISKLAKTLLVAPNSNHYADSERAFSIIKKYTLNLDLT